MLFDRNAIYHLKLEEDLVDELIMIYRTPTLLLEKTKL